MEPVLGRQGFKSVLGFYTPANRTESPQDEDEEGDMSSELLNGWVVLVGTVQND